MATLQEQLRELTDQLEQGVKNIFTNGQYEQYLNVMSQFHSYSFRNSMLIWLQRPDATHVAGFNTWKNTFGRSVNKGEKGIRIFAPAPYKRRTEETHDQQGNLLRDENGNPTIIVKEITVPAFKPVYVFDASQTSGKEIPSLGSELSEKAEGYELLFETFKNISPYPLVFENIEGNAEGYCDFINEKIVLNSGKSQAQNIAVALHEIAHSRLHQPNLPSELQKDRQTKEIEAESIAFVVGAHYGIQTDISSFGYIAGWSKDQELNKLQASLETIQKAAAELINDIDAQIQIITQTQVQTQTKSVSDEPSPIYKLIDEYEQYGTPQWHGVFGTQEKDLLVNYALHQANFDEVGLLAAELAEASHELKHGYVDPKVKQRIDQFNEKIDRLQFQNNNPSPIYLDAPFVPPINIIDGNSDIFPPIHTINLDTGERTLVGFNQLREYTFEANAYRDCLFENNAVDIGTKNLHFEGYPDSWEVVDKMTLRDDTYFAVVSKDQSQYMIINQAGNVFIDQAFKDMVVWEQKDLLDLVSSTLTEREVNRINTQHLRSAQATKPSIGDKLEKAKQQALASKTDVNKPNRRAIRVGMER